MTFAEVQQEFHKGSPVQFAYNAYRADRRNGQAAQMVAINAASSGMVLEREAGHREKLDPNHLVDRHLRLG